MPDAPSYRIGPQPGAPLYVPEPLSNMEGPQKREPSKCLNGQSYRERLGIEVSELPPTRAWKKTLIGQLPPVAEAV